MQQLLRIHWSDETEFVGFDEDDDFPSQLKTTARWSDSQEVTYYANATLQKNGNDRILKLDYQSTQQADPLVNGQPLGEIRYGECVITWRSGDATGTAEWTDAEQGMPYNGTVNVAVLGGQQLSISERARRSVIVKQRPQQREFRDALFQLDKQCVLTGEKCREVLQAAHVIPVAKEGYEQIENGILLRADLHLLFDAGLIWFEVSGDGAAIKYLPCDLTERYVMDLKEKYLPWDTFRRVKAALLARAELPGGRGRNTIT